jgi:proteasome lid subunit RPN8/RPN11
MKLVLPYSLVLRLKQAMRTAGHREIGGVLVGEHLGGDSFRVADLSVQHSGGSAVHFVRDLEQSRVFLSAFFSKTGNDYSRFNYLGEWHSHPSFSPLPSSEDVATMLSIVRDPQVGVHFAVLVIATLRGRSNIMLSATAFRSGAEPESANVEMESEGERKPSWLKTVLSFLR